MEEKRAYTRNQLREMGFHAAEYSFPTFDGSFIGTLVMKKWGDNKNLICYFITETGEKIKLCLWYNPKKRKSFTVSGVCFADVKLDTEWVIIVCHGKNGKTRWLEAYPAGKGG